MIADPKGSEARDDALRDPRPVRSATPGPDRHEHASAPDQVALWIVLLLAGIALTGDFRVQLASSTADDSPVLFARFLADPTHFRSDVLATYAYTYAFGSMINWLPALLYRVTALSPILTSWVIALLQTILLGVALHRLTWIVTADRTKAWAAAAFGLAAEVYVWNLANFSSQMAIPYAGHLALPLALFALASWITARHRSCAGWLGLTALVHPTLALLVIGLLLALAVDRRGERVRLLLALALPALLALIPPLAILGRWGGDLPAAVLLEEMRANIHMNPFGTGRFSILLRNFAAFVALVGLGLWRQPIPPAYRRLLSGSLLWILVLGVLHYLALRLAIYPVVTLIPLRFSLIVLVAAVPLVVSLLVDVARSGGWSQRWAAALLLVAPCLGAPGPHPVAIGVLALGSWPVAGRTAQPARRFAALALLLLLAWSVGGALIDLSALASSNPVVMWLGAPDADAFGLAGVLALASTRHVPNSRALPSLLCGVLTALLFVRNAGEGVETLSGLKKDLYDAQVWASRHTDRSAVFVLEPNIPWRVVADRPVVHAIAPGLHVYSRSSTAWRHAHAVEGELRLHPITDRSAAVAFAERFGGDYLVRWPERPRVLPLVYSNASYAIYDLSIPD